MVLINLTPHVIHLPGQSIEPSGLARCEEKSVLVGKIGPIELIAREYGEVAGLPEPAPNVLYIVSGIVRMANPDRHDLASPGDLMRDERGAIVGAKNLIVNR